jgi:prepilin-type N-terminal cleavage/methylation domain-containing protein
MTHKKARAFTLIELMVVIVIIGVFSALAIPGILEVRYRNALTDTVAKFRAAAATVRDLSLQTKQAAVLEVRTDKAWINLLEGPSCNSVTNTDLMCRETFDFVDPESSADKAGVAMCGGRVLTGDCTASAAVELPAGGFSLCYSGAGELFYRLGSDPSVCDDSNPPDPTGEDTWFEPCNIATPQLVNNFKAAAELSMDDGAAIMFNRFGHGTACGNTAGEDVARFVVFPTSGIPHTRIAGVE